MSLRHTGRRAGARNRAKLNEARRAVLRSVWPQLVLLGAGVLGVLALSSWLLVALAHAPYLAGFYAGAGVTAYLASLHWAADLFSGAHNDKFGAQGEEATSEAFRTRRMQERGWRIIDAIPFSDCDVDHVAARPGLVVAVESKWTHVPWRFVHGRLVTPGGSDPVEQARRGAAKIARHLHPVVDTVVIPLVVVWGTGADSLPFDINRTDDVWIVRGVALPELDSSLEPFEASLPTAADVDAIVGRLDEFIAARDDYESKRAALAS